MLSSKNASIFSDLGYTLDDINLDDLSPTYTPKKIDRNMTRHLFIDCPESVKVWARILFQEKGWRIYVVDQSRGYCAYRAKLITIPSWVIRKCERTGDIGEKIWYIAHEMAHAFDTDHSVHGQPFMQWLIRICPAEYIHHELGYKPRNAAAAGIMNPDQDIELLDL